MLPGSETLFRVLWPLVWPVRLYVRYMPWLRGKGVLIRNVLLPLLPHEPVLLKAKVPGDRTVLLRYRETLGWSTLLFGDFEAKELAHVVRYLRPGDVAFDVGANVGLYSVATAGAVGASGQVICVEPMPQNIAMIQRNARENRLDNIHCVACAVSDSQGTAQLHLANDSAYPSLLAVEENRGTGRTLTVAMRTLDDIWQEAGTPAVRFIKLDVEGAELQALRGATRLLASCRPAVLFEANSQQAFAQLSGFFESIGFTLSQPAGFLPHNHWAQG